MYDTTGLVGELYSIILTIETASYVVVADKFRFAAKQVIPSCVLLPRNRVGGGVGVSFCYPG